MVVRCGMKKDTERQLNEAYNHMLNYFKDEECTEELREMCQNCEVYSGTEHDYAECKGRMCFNFYLAFEYLEWSNAFK